MGVQSNTSWPCGQDSQPEPGCHRRRNAPRGERLGLLVLTAGPATYFDGRSPPVRACSRFRAARASTGRRSARESASANHLPLLRAETGLATGSAAPGDHRDPHARGLRTGELCALNCAHIDLAHRVIRAIDAKTVEGADERVLCRALVDRWRDPDSNRGHHDFQSWKQIVAICSFAGKMA
jgi:hypothetical protein